MEKIDIKGMSHANYTLNILMNNSWRQGFSTWTFRESSISIHDHAANKSEKNVLFSIDEDEGGNLVIRTDDESLGELCVTVVDDGTTVKICLTSTALESIDIRLFAFQGFSSEQKNSIEALLSRLRKAYESKREEINSRVFHLGKTSKPDRHILIKDYGFFLHQMNHQIEMIEMVVHSTIHIASDYQEYLNNLREEVERLETEMSAV